MLALAILSWATVVALLVILVRLARLPDMGFGGANHRRTASRRRSGGRPAVGGAFRRG